MEVSQNFPQYRAFVFVASVASVVVTLIVLPLLYFSMFFSMCVNNCDAIFFRITCFLLAIAAICIAALFAAIQFKKSGKLFWGCFATMPSVFPCLLTLYLGAIWPLWFIAAFAAVANFIFLITYTFRLKRA